MIESVPGVAVELYTTSPRVQGAPSCELLLCERASPNQIPVQRGECYSGWYQHAGFIVPLLMLDYRMFLRVPSIPSKNKYLPTRLSKMNFKINLNALAGPAR